MEDREPRPDDADYCAYHGSLTLEGREELYARIRAEHEAEKDERRAALTELREAFKASKRGYSMIRVYMERQNTTGFIGDCMRGNYPHYDGNRLPVGMATALRKMGFTVPEILG